MELCPLCERPNHHPSDHHLVPRSRGGKVTETICSDCHRAIHATFTNKELERGLNTVESLLQNAELAKTIAFIAKQDPGGRIRTHSAKRKDGKR